MTTPRTAGPPQGDRRLQKRLGLGLVAVGLAWTALVLVASRRSEDIDLLRFPLAWAGVLCALDGAVRARHGRSPLTRSADWLWMGCASVFFWDLFELLNLRLKNWWYTGETSSAAAGALFSFLSFATVLPAVRLGEALLCPVDETSGNGLDAQAPAAPPLARGERHSRARWWSGVGLTSLVLALWQPRLCYPLAWLFLFPLGEAALLVLGNRPPGLPRSPMESMREGDRTLVLRLFAFALPLGLVWEGLNWGCARGWIYTVPYFDDRKLFEMPLLGYLGYPPFLLEAGALLALVERVRRRITPRGAILLVLLVAGFHAGIDGLGRAHTSVSPAPRLTDSVLLASLAAPAQAAGISTPRALLEASAREGSIGLARRLGVKEGTLTQALALSALAHTLGMGLAHAELATRAGVGAVEQLAAQEEPTLSGRLHETCALQTPPCDGPPPALVRFWIKRARRLAHPPGSASDPRTGR